MDMQTRGQNVRKLVVSENITLGRGRRPFDSTVSVATLSFAEARPFRPGVVLLTYQPTDPGRENSDVIRCPD